MRRILGSESAAQAVFNLMGARLKFWSTTVVMAKGKAWEIPLEDDLSMVARNIPAILRLTKLFLPRMVRDGF